MRHLRFWSLNLLPALVLLTACAGIPKSPAPVPAKYWKSISGQVRYQDPKRTLIGDVVLRVGPDQQQYSLEVSKAGAVLLQLDRAGEVGWAKGLLAHRPYNGSAADSPAHLRNWYRQTDVAVGNKATLPALAGEPTIKFLLER